MRIGEISRLTGVSVRSLRHYHRLGIVDEPPRTAGGYRVYSVDDLVRVMRVRHLAESGVPLRQVAALLDSGEGESDPAAGLARLREELDERIAALRRQRERLDVLEARVTAGLPVGLVPAGVDRALKRCAEDAAGDPQLLRVLDRERDMLDLLALSTEFPDGLTAVYTRIADDPATRSGYLRVLAGFAAIEGRRPSEVEAEIAGLVSVTLADESLRELVAGAPAPDHGGDPGPSADQLVGDPAQREVVRRVLAGLGLVLDGDGRPS